MLVYNANRYINRVHSVADKLADKLSSETDKDSQPGQLLLLMNDRLLNVDLVIFSISSCCPVVFTTTLLLIAGENSLIVDDLKII